MRYITVTLFLLFSSLAAEACSCFKGTLTSQILNRKTYVALVKIKEQIDFVYNQGDTIQYKVAVEEILLLKGRSSRTLIIEGAPPGSENILTSCDMAVLSGEEWLVIDGHQDGIPITGMCSYSIRYRTADGFRDWQSRWAIDQLDFVIKELSKSTGQLSDHDKPELYYAAGKPERIIPYKNGKKHGTVMYYYPGGQLYGSIGYKADSLDGKSIWYHRDGSIYQSDKYKRGTQVGTSINYGMRFSPSFMNIYSKKGVLKRSKQFFKNYEGLTPLDTMNLSSETIYKNGKRYKSIYYESDGKVKSIKYFDENNEEVYPLEPGPNF